MGHAVTQEIVMSATAVGGPVRCPATTRRACDGKLYRAYVFMSKLVVYQDGERP